MVETVVKTYFDVLGGYVQLDDYNNKCYIFEREAPYIVEKPGKPAIVKDGLHMMFPAIKCYERLKWVARDHVMKGSARHCLRSSALPIQLMTLWKRP